MIEKKSLGKVFFSFSSAALILASCTIVKTRSNSVDLSSTAVSSGEGTSVGQTSSAAAASTSSDEVSHIEASSVAASTSVETDDNAIVLAQGASSSSASGVTIDNDKNFITLSSVGTYVLSGSLTEGSIIITAETAGSEDTVTLVLNGVTLSSSGAHALSVTSGTSPATIYPGPIYSENSAHLSLEIPSSSSSVLTDKRAASLASGDDSAAIFSNKLLTISGEGSLNVTSTYHNGLGSDSKLKANGVTLSVSAPAAALKAHNAIILGGASEKGSFTLTSTAVGASSSDYPSAVRVDEVDAVASPLYGNGEENDDIAGIEFKDASYVIAAVGKGVSSEAYLYLEGGNGTVASSTDKGLKAELDVHIDGGDFAVTTPEDDCIHSSTAKVIATGGTYVLASGTTDGCQGLKGETEVDISGGAFTVKSSYEGIAAHKINVSGGTTIVTAADDGWSAGGTDSKTSPECAISITGGFNYSYAGGDGLDSNGYFTISGGTTIVAGPSESHDSPLDSGDGYDLTINGGTIIAYGITGMVEKMVGTQNSVVLNSIPSVSSGKYFVFLVNGAYYAVETARTATTVSASFPEYGAKPYAIAVASGVTVSDPLFEAGSFYEVSAYTSSSSLTSGTFGAATGTHVYVGGSGGGGGRG